MQVATLCFHLAPKYKERHKQEKQERQTQQKQERQKQESKRGRKVRDSHGSGARSCCKSKAFPFSSGDPGTMLPVPALDFSRQALAGVPESTLNKLLFF